MRKLCKLAAFVNGVREFRSDVTTHYDDYDMLCTYDAGREMAHKLTARRYDTSWEG